MKCYTRYACHNDYHYVGGARMGADGDSMAVLDERLRVRGVQGLRVADNSAIPSIPRGNTMAIAYIIGEKASDMIQEDWS